MASTAQGPWSSLFHNVPARTPASHLYTEDSISNEELTAEQLIDKAQTNANLLLEFISASASEILNIRDFENSEVIQTLHKECQGISDYLFERIWHDSGNDPELQYYSYEGSSHQTAPKTADEEAQIAAFIGCSEQIQAAFRSYEELKDHLQAKKLQEQEDLLASVRDLPNTRKLSQASGSRDGSGHGGQSIAGHDAMRHHLRKSEQPLLWKLDPREDFKANKMKMKKKVDHAQRERIEQERSQERREALNIPSNVVEIPPEVLVIDHPEISQEEREREERDYKKQKEQEIVEALEPEVGGKESQTLNPSIVWQSESVGFVNGDDDEEGALSDDSWEEIPVPHMAAMSIQDSTSSSSNSSFLITSPGARHSTPDIH
ncbi:hypothetical protein BG004_003827 [Podila humilis]|nr:hypothetical protein BG004_003827 [Podila humilis]